MSATSNLAGRATARPLLACQSDERLVALLRAGNDAAFEAIVRRYRGALVAYSRRLLDDGRAEDAVQQALLNAYRAMLSGDADIELRAWLYRVVHNATLDALRRGGLETVARGGGVHAAEPPDEAFERRERLCELVAAIQALPQCQRDAIVLRELEGRGHEEIAAQLGLTGGAVRQLIHRARARLRAGASAVMPFGALDWAARGSGGEALSARLPELVAGATATGAAAKAGVAIIVAGGIAGGGATVMGPGVGVPPDRPADPAAEVRADRAPGPVGRAAVAATERKPERPARPTRRRTDRSPGAVRRTRRQSPRQPRAASPTSGGHPVTVRQGAERDIERPEAEQFEVEEPDPADPVEDETAEAEAPEPDDEEPDDEEIDD